MTVRGVAIAVALIAVLLGGGWLWRQPAAGLAAEGASDAAADGTVTVSVDAVNYMHDWGVEYTLTDLRSNTPVGGAIVGPLEGPGGKGCCVSLPAKWQPGIRFQVSWQESNKELTRPETYRREVELPRYRAPGDVYVLFYPQQQVEVLVSAVEPGHPGWPGRIQQPAYPACVARLGQKECEKLLPKYAPGSVEESAKMMREACSEKVLSKAKDIAEDRKACAALQTQCRQWPLDERMCEFDYVE